MPEAAVQRVLIVSGGSPAAGCPSGSPRRRRGRPRRPRRGLGASATASRSRATHLRRSTPSGSTTGSPSGASRLASCGWSADGHVIWRSHARDGGPDCRHHGRLRGDLADILVAGRQAGVDVRLGTTVTLSRTKRPCGDAVQRHHRDRRPAGRRRRRPLEGARDDRYRGPAEATVAWASGARWPKRPAEITVPSSTSAGRSTRPATPPSSKTSLRFLFEENLDRSFVGDGAEAPAQGAHPRVQRHLGQYVTPRRRHDRQLHGSRRSASTPRVPAPLDHHRDAAHAWPPLIAQGAAMCAEDAVILAEMLTSGPGCGGRGAAGVHGASLPAREDGAGQQPDVGRVGDPPGDAGCRPRPDHGPDPSARWPRPPDACCARTTVSRTPASTGSSTGG